MKPASDGDRATEMEADRVLEAIPVPTPARHPFDPLVPCIHRLRRHIRRLEHHRVQDPLEVGPDHARRAHRRLEPTPPGERRPREPGLSRPADAEVVPKPRGRLLQRSGAACAGAEVLELRQQRSSLTTHRCRVLPPRVLRADERAVALRAQPLVLLLAHGVYPLAEVPSRVEAV